MRYPDIISLCQIDKSYQLICSYDYVWKELLRRDFNNIFNLDDKFNYKMAYEKLYKRCNQATLLIIKNNMNTRYLYKSMDSLYLSIFQTVIEFISINIDYTTYVDKLSLLKNSEWIDPKPYVEKIYLVLQNHLWYIKDEIQRELHITLSYIKQFVFLI